MKKQVTILGAGITGLALGYYLRERFKDSIDLKILEKTDRPGGWIKSIKTGPFLFEQGPRTLRCSGGETSLELVEKIGLKDSILHSKKEANIRYLFKEERLQKVSFFSPLFNGKRWAIFKGLCKKEKGRADDSIYSYVERRFSKAVAQDLFAPMALGIFAGDIRSLSLKHCFPKLYEGKFSFSGSGLFTLKGGLEELPRRLAEILKDDIHYGETCANPTFSTVPLDKIPMQSVAIAQFGWLGKQLKIPGFGYLIPRGNLMGVVFDSEIFPESSPTTRLSVMMREPNLKEALEHIKKVLTIEQDPDFCSLTEAKNAIPQYPIGFDQILEQIHAEKKETLFLGSSYTGVSVNECIRAAKKVAYSF